MSDPFHIVLLPGDGIGEEVTTSARLVLEAVSERLGISLSFEVRAFGGAGIENSGNPLPDGTLKACKEADAVLLGAIGGPQWDHLSGELRPEAGLLRLRAELGVFANLRPTVVPESLAHLSILPAEIVAGVDLLVVRELTGGIYFGEPKEYTPTRAFDTMIYCADEIDRIARVAFERASGRRQKVTSVDKANVLAVSRLWRERVSYIGANEYPDIELVHMYVDNAAMQMVLNPLQFDVLLTGNLFGDILSDLSSTLVGSLGLLPSASLGGITPLFEPVHGSAPELAGTNSANPIGAILSGAMMLDELGEYGAAMHIAEGVSGALSLGALTEDLTPEGGSRASTSEFTDHVLAYLNESAVSTTNI